MPLTSPQKTIMPTKDQALSLPRSMVNKILTHAQQNPDIEICGLIGNSETNKSKDYYAIDNVSENPACRFLMDAQQQIKAMKEMRDKQQQLFAIVHSHPTTNAIPSQRDIKENNYRDVYYIIISLNTKDVPEVRGYIPQSDSMQEVDIDLI